MKRTFTSLLALSCAVILHAQPSITSTNLINTGTVLTLKTATVTDIDTTIQGASKTWDFSNLQEDVTADDWVITYMDVAQTPYGTNFPTSNYCFKETDGSGMYYRYFKLDANKLERVGSQQSGNPTPNTYSDPQIEMTFPLTMGTSSHDTWANTNSSFGGTYDFECIGYGTLKLPGSQVHNNVLMVRVVVEELFEIPAYFWYGSDGTVLLEYVVGDGFFVGSAVKYLNSMTTTGIADQAGMETISVSFKNPVTQQLELTLNQVRTMDMQYEIVNTVGETVRSGKIDQSVKTVAIDMADMKPGIYYFTATGGNEAIRAVKLLKL